MTEEQMQQPKQTDYSPEEIQQAQQEENNLLQAQIIQQVQQRNIALNIEVRRAQKKAAELEAENATVRSLLNGIGQAEEAGLKKKPIPPAAKKAAAKKAAAAKKLAAAPSE